MRILIINGSPKKDGNISTMMNIIRTESTKKGYETHYVWINGMNIHPCTGCMSCRTYQKCILPSDDAQQIIEHIKAADALFVGAPSYWGNIPGQLKILFDRIVYGLIRTPIDRNIPIALHKGKKAFIVCTCTTPFPFNILFNQSRGTIKALKRILKTSGFRITGTLEKGNTKSSKGLTTKEINTCKKFIDKI